MLTAEKRHGGGMGLRGHEVDLQERGEDLIRNTLGGGGTPPFGGKLDYWESKSPAKKDNQRKMWEEVSSRVPSFGDGDPDELTNRRNVGALRRRDTGGGQFDPDLPPKTLKSGRNC